MVVISKVKKIFSIALSLSIIFPSIVSADIYKVSGNSMYPTLKDGNFLKKVSNKYEIGDTVVAKDKQTGETVVKNIKGEKLIGENKTTKIYNTKDMDILGKVEKTNLSSQTNVIEVKAAEAPLIEKAYAGDSTAIFLNEDTSITGFGKNISGLFKSKGTANTASLTQISGPTGYEKLKVSLGNDRKDDYLLGFRPNADGTGFYNVYRVLPDTNQLMFSNVRDGFISFPFNTIYLKVNEDGRVQTQGTEGQNYYLGLGYGFPFGRGETEGGYQYIVDEVEKAQTVIASGPEYEHADKTQNGSFTTPSFTIPEGEPNFNIRAYDMESLNGWNNSQLKIELLDANTENVVSTFNKPWNRNSTEYSNIGSKGYTNMPGSYKLRVTSSDISYKIQVEIRHDFPHKVLNGAALGAVYGAWSIVTEENEIYMHGLGYGYVRKVKNIPENLHFKKDSLEGGNNKFHIIDEYGRAWMWSTENDFKMVAFPQVDNKDFYSQYEVVEVANAYTMNMYKVKNRETGDTYVYVNGKGDYGELGLSGITSVSEPTVVSKKGKPLKNIQTIAAGRFFTIIVQNTDDGQLVWTAGKNESGQLGGGVDLTVPEPFIVPGLNNIKLVQGYRGENTEHKFAYNSLVMSEDKMYGFGESLSYPKEVNIGNIPYISEVKQSYSIMTFLSKEDRVPYIAGNAWRGRRAGTLNDFDKIPADSNFVDTYNDGQKTFSNVRALQAVSEGGALIDSKGRIWSWGLHITAGQGLHMRPDGAYQWTEKAKPALIDGDDPSSIGPAIFTQLGGLGSITQALDENNKIWYITNHLYPIPSSADINNVKIEKIYGGVNSGAAVDETGRLWVFGDNSYGKLGLGNDVYVSQNNPVLLNPSYYNNEKIVHVSMLLKHTLFVTDKGNVYAMGDNTYGQLGDGTYNSSSTPIKVMNIKNAVMVGGGDLHSLVVDKDGRVWAFGYAGDGSLGNNFSLTRDSISTAVGNDLPEMSVLSDIQDYYLSKNGNTDVNLYGTVREKEGETTTVKTTILGLEKEKTIDASEWELDIYDRVKPKEWNFNVNINELGDEQIFQSLVKVSAEDERGGITEQYFSGRIIVDNEKPEAPQWGDTCIVNKGVESCHDGTYFKNNGTNGVNNPVRIYIKPTQKSGQNKAPVKPQIQYRIKQSYGYAPKWSDWIDVNSSNQNGYYYDFFQGFLGETQLKIRSVDAAGNVSEENNEYRYTIINNAGAEVDKIKTEAKTVDKKLVNNIIFSLKTPSGSSIKSYGVKRRLYNSSDWVDLTPSRIPFTSTEETTYSDSSEELLGNTKYEYAVNAQNTIAIGQDTNTTVVTNPYDPVNFIRKVSETGVKFIAKQDERNRGEILYRLVLTDNSTGEIYSLDKTSSNIKEEVVFDVKEGDAPFSILNNSIKITLLVRGTNGQFTTLIYDNNFESAPSVIADKKAPDVYISVEGNPERIISDGENGVNISFSATDDVSVNSKLTVQFSADGTNWYGLNSNGTWEKNFWSAYNPTYKGFPLGKTTGTRVIYARARDEAGNTGLANTKILVADLVQRNENSLLVDSKRNISSQDTLTNAIYVNDVFVELNIPKTGNITEVQYSFDGVNWSPWEAIIAGTKKYISLPTIEGEHSIVTRFKNEYGDITTIKDKNDILKYVLDKSSPDLLIETVNGTRITKDTGILFKVTALDNLSKNIKISLSTSGLEMYSNGVKASSVTLANNTEKELFINGLKQGFNVISFNVQDMAGNSDTKTLRIFKK